MQKLIFLLSDMIFPLLLGYLLQQKGWLSEQICKQLILCNILILGTVLSILSCWTLPLRWELAWLPAFGILLSFIPGAAACCFVRSKYQNLLDQGSYLLSATLSNIGTLGGLGAFVLFGEAGFAYTQIVAFFQNLVLFLICFPLAQYCQQQSSPEKASNLPFRLLPLLLTRNQLPVLGLLGGMLLYGSGIPRPAALGDIFTPLVHISAWIALIPVGYSLNFRSVQKYYLPSLDLLPIKFVLTPVLTYFIARLFFQDPDIIGTLLLLASVPTGINAVVTARLYNLNLHIPGAAFILTTLVFLIVIYPAFFLFFSA